MKKRHAWGGAALLAACVLSSCMGTQGSMSNGGELTGVGSSMIWNEPTPYGMVLVQRGSLKMGPEEQDSLWGTSVPTRDISIESFWMDETRSHRSRVPAVCLLGARLHHPRTPGRPGLRRQRTLQDRGRPRRKPHQALPQLGAPIPWKRATEDEQLAIQSVYRRHPVDGTLMLDASQMNYYYEVYDYVEAAKRRNRLNPAERNKNTDITPTTRKW